MNLVAQHRNQLLPIVLPALEDNSSSHWNPAVHGLTMNVRKMFQELDEQLYEDVKRSYESEEQQVRQLHESRDKRWSALQLVALKKAPKGLLEAKLGKYQIMEAPSPV